MEDRLFQTLELTGFNKPNITMCLANSVLLQFDTVSWLAIHRN